jgi:hypothetical protein
MRQDNLLRKKELKMNVMTKRMKTFLECHTFLGSFARRRRNKRMEERYDQWVEDGSVLPMPHLGKRKVVLDYAARFKPEVFIETGTYTGHMVYGVMNEFREIYSIELDIVLSEKAKVRFEGYRHVHILQGDSGKVLPEILKTISEPCLFWLDAHYSQGATAKGDLETPIIQELNCILGREGSAHDVLLIDDARSYTGKNDYPDLNSLEKFILDIRPDWVFEIKDDIIRSHAKESPQ